MEKQNHETKKRKNDKKKKKTEIIKKNKNQGEIKMNDEVKNAQKKKLEVRNDKTSGQKYIYRREKKGRKMMESTKFPFLFPS